MAQVGIGVIGDNRKEHYYREREQISCLDRHVESGIIRNAHGTLHPVNDAAGVRTRRSAAANKHPRIVGYLGELFGNWTMLTGSMHRPGQLFSTLW